MRKFRFRTVRSRLVAAYAGIFIGIILLLSAVIYRMTVRVLSDRNRQTYEKVLTAAEEVLDDKLSIFENNARLLMANDTLQQVMAMEDPGNDGMYMSLSRRNRLLEVIRSFTNNISDLIGVYLFDTQGKLCYLDQSRTSAEVEEGISYERLSREGWFASLQEARGGEVFFGEDILYGAEHLMSCGKIINQLKTNQPLGIMVMLVRKEALRSVVGAFPVEKDTYLLLADENVVYRNGQSEEAYGPTLSRILQGREDSIAVTLHTCREPGWSIAHFVEKKNLFSDAGLLARMIAGIAVSGSVLMLISSIWQAYRITRPLKDFQDDIRRVGEGERSFTHAYEDDEIGEIGREFQRMVTESLELKERVSQETLLRRESQLQLLQSQINPHFLYNTLETLYWMAMSEDAENVADLTRALSDIFKISLNEGEDFICVRDEITFIEDYLHIQNVRFDGKFLVQIQVEEAIEERRIPKQILQPFVENAIYHGLEPKLEKGNLRITGRREGTELVFTVADDGVGIPQGKNPRQGYAISNVVQRLELYYGKEGRVLIDSKTGEGTRVTICLPDVQA